MFNETIWCLVSAVHCLHAATARAKWHRDSLTLNGDLFGRFRRVKQKRQKQSEWFNAVGAD